MKNFCLDLREHAKKIVRKRNDTINKWGNKSHREQKNILNI